MRKLVILGGKLPKEDPGLLERDPLGYCTGSMWCNLADTLARRLDGHAEVWWWGDTAPSFHDPTDKLRILVNPDTGHLAKATPADVVLSVGYRDAYRPVLTSWESSKRVYYADGGKPMPPDNRGHDWEYCLVDTPKQQHKVGLRHRRKVVRWLRPVSLVFRPVQVRKRYDLVVLSEISTARAGAMLLNLVSRHMADRCRVLWMGPLRGNAVQALYDLKLNERIEVGGFYSNIRLPRLISMARVGLVLGSTTHTDRTATPKMLACGLPVVAVPGAGVDAEGYLDGVGAVVEGGLRSVLHYLHHVRPLLGRNDVTAMVAARHRERCHVEVAAEALVSGLRL